MSLDLLERMIGGYMATYQPQYAFGWQGGEPTLMGLDFFEKVTELQQKLGRSGSSVANGLQTNGTLIDDKFAAHLARYNFLIGVSLDGPAEIHDHFRTAETGADSHERVLRGMAALRRNNAEFNILTLVNSVNVKRGRDVYRYLRDMDVNFHQYIPCVEFDDRMQPMPYSISADAWGDFLCEIYDEWLAHDTRRVSVRIFDSILSLMVERKPNVCHMEDNCCQYFVVEYNGDVYPCDFFVEAGKKLGNVTVDTWDTIQSSTAYSAFGALKQRWSTACANCRYLEYCKGDCLKHRPSGNADTSWLCAGWQRFYAHSLPGFRRLADEVLEEREKQRLSAQIVLPNEIGSGKTGRNSPCPCGSGRKYKKCHGAQK
jgi:uncharacterized protein